MTDAAVREAGVCELDGCDNTVDRLPGSTELRRYCCAAHRKIARKGRPELPPRSVTPPAPARNAGQRQQATNGALAGESNGVAGHAPGGAETKPDVEVNSAPETDAPDDTAGPDKTAGPADTAAPAAPGSPADTEAARPADAPAPEATAEQSEATAPAEPVNSTAPAKTSPPIRTTSPADTAEPTHVIEPAAPTGPRDLRDAATASVPVLAAAPFQQVQPSFPNAEAGRTEPTTSHRDGGTAWRAALAARRAKKRDSPINPNPVIQVAWFGEAREALSAALHSLSANRLRSVLTTIGIIAGMASVIMMVAMGNGMAKGFNDQFSRFATQLTIKPVTGPVVTGKAPQHLTDQDYRALHDTNRAPDIALLSAAVASNSVTLTEGQQKAGSGVYGIEQNYLDLDNRHMVAGTWFTQKQISDGVRQAVLGPETVNLLWGPGTDPHTVIGQPLRVGHSTFQIQGVVNSDGQDDNLVLVPLAAARAYVVGNNGGKLDVIIAKSPNIATLDQAEGEIYQILYNQHHVRTETDRDFTVTDNTNILQQEMSTIKFMQMFIVAIAAISLFVGGVGVANIMLVSVTERTREIGIRKAIGAPRRAIMRQFLSEAVMVTALGGAIGVVLGIGLCLLGKAVIPKLWPPDPYSLTPTPLPILSIYPVLIAFGVSLVIGLLAGCYPAYRLRPIEALRFE